MIQIKSKREIEIMRKSGALVAQVLNHLVDQIKPGVTLIQLDEMAEKMTLDLGAKPAFKGYLGFKHALCTSVNEQIVHGVPTGRALKEGDIVGLDFGLVYEGFYGDSAVTVPVGRVSESAWQLLEDTREALYAAIAVSTPNHTLKDLARAIESHTKPKKYGVVRDFVGHGIGQKLHEEPQIANYEAGAGNLRLRAGMTICIEPMVNQGTHEVKVLDDKWTAVTRDGKLSAHFEHTLLITENEPEVLTEWTPSRFERVFKARHA